MLVLSTFREEFTTNVEVFMDAIGSGDSFFLPVLLFGGLLLCVTTPCILWSVIRYYNKQKLASRERIELPYEYQSFGFLGAAFAALCMPIGTWMFITALVAIAGPKLLQDQVFAIAGILTWPVSIWILVLAGIMGVQSAKTAVLELKLKKLTA
jgi:energy-converting hydrogenase Eha subunit C